MTVLDWFQTDTVAPTALRALIGFVAAWALFKLGKKRFLKRGSAFDALIAIMVGAVMGRGIVEGEHFLPSIAAGAVIVAAHWVFASLARRHGALAELIEGHERCLMADGVVDQRQMSRALVSEDDLIQALRLRTGQSDLSLVEAAWQEKSGEISLRLKPTAAP